MLVQRHDLQVTSGEVAENIYPLNDNELHRHHCTQCGTALWFSSTQMPEIIAIKPGTFDDTSWFKPIAHLWVRSAQPWVSLDPDTPKYQQQPSITELLELWKTSQEA